MLPWLTQLPPVWQALLATAGTWLLTAVGATLVFAVRSPPRHLMDACLGFAAGIMVAAACWSLLVPAIDRGGVWPACAGTLLGWGAIFCLDQLLPHLHLGADRPEGPSTAWRRTRLLILAVTIHNVPEGLAIGVAFGADDLATAFTLALGIGLQNVPEGLAVALPLRREGLSRTRAWFWGQASALVEPVAGLAGILLVTIARPLLPYALAFAAGAMLYVVVELLPEVVRDGHTDLGAGGFLLGFVLMMTLDNALA